MSPYNMALLALFIVLQLVCDFILMAHNLKLLSKVVQLQMEQDAQRAVQGQLTSNILNHLIAVEARVDKLDPEHQDD